MWQCLKFEILVWTVTATLYDIWDIWWNIAMFALYFWIKVLRIIYVWAFMHRNIVKNLKQLRRFIKIFQKHSISKSALGYCEFLDLSSLEVKTTGGLCMCISQKVVTTFIRDCFTFDSINPSAYLNFRYCIVKYTI